MTAIPQELLKLVNGRNPDAINEDILNQPTEVLNFLLQKSYEGNNYEVNNRLLSLVINAGKFSEVMHFDNDRLFNLAASEQLYGATYDVARELLSLAEQFSTKEEMSAMIHTNNNIAFVKAVEKGSKYQIDFIDRAARVSSEEEFQEMLHVNDDFAFRRAAYHGKTDLMLYQIGKTMEHQGGRARVKKMIHAENDSILNCDLILNDPDFTEYLGKLEESETEFNERDWFDNCKFTFAKALELRDVDIQRTVLTSLLQKEPEFITTNKRELQKMIHASDDASFSQSAEKMNFYTQIALIKISTMIDDAPELNRMIHLRNDYAFEKASNLNWVDWSKTLINAATINGYEEDLHKMVCMKDGSVLQQVCSQGNFELIDLMLKSLKELERAQLIVDYDLFSVTANGNGNVQVLQLLVNEAAELGTLSNIAENPEAIFLKTIQNKDFAAASYIWELSTAEPEIRQLLSNSCATWPKLQENKAWDGEGFPDEWEERKDLSKSSISFLTAAFGGAIDQLGEEQQNAINQLKILKKTLIPAFKEADRLAEKPQHEDSYYDCKSNYVLAALMRENYATNKTPLSEINASLSKLRVASANSDQTLLMDRVGLKTKNRSSLPEEMIETTTLPFISGELSRLDFVGMPQQYKNSARKIVGEFLFAPNVTVKNPDALPVVNTQAKQGNSV